MILLLGASLGCGMLLVVSPWLWQRPPVARAARTTVLSRLIDDAGLARTVSSRTVALITVSGSVMVAALAWLLAPGVPLWVLAGVAAGAAPTVWLRSRAYRRRAEHRALWPDVCDLLVSSIRAGMSLPDAVAALAASGPLALRDAFANFAADVAASGHFDASIVELKRRLADPVGDRVMETLRMARDVGGTELVPTLRALSAAVRAEAALRAEVASRQSWIRGAAILAALAPWVILALLALRPEAAAAYSSTVGVLLVLSGAVVTAVAYRVMIRVGRLPESRRWFA
ncbi:type II secretion system F family protein [Microbacterium sediminicola]|uniref:Type II secretion system F family protein n=1 Tax=Microbacterium sediminicola TaxID=415210 RepID=A0ABN2HNI7_9MICO